MFVFPRVILTSVSLQVNNNIKLLNRNIIINVKNFFHTTKCNNFADRYFTEKHEWVLVNEQVGIVGISDYAQAALGDVVYAQLPDVGTVVKQKEECGALESVKAASEIYSPVSGKILEKNLEVEKTPSLINSSCYDKGWLFKLELTNQEELKDLMTEDNYKKYLTTQESQDNH